MTTKDAIRKIASILAQELTGTKSQIEELWLIAYGELEDDND